MAYTPWTLKRKWQREIDDKVYTSFQRNLQVTPGMIKRLGLEKELEGHTGCVNCLEWNETGSLLASGSDDVQVIIWDPFRHRSLAVVRTGHQGNIFSVKFLPASNDRTIVTGAADCKICVHDLVAEETSRVFSCHAGRVKRIATAPNLPFVFWSAAEDGCIMQFDLRCPETNPSLPGNILINLNAHMGDYAEAKCLAVNPLRPELMAVGANDPYIRVYDRRMLSCRSMKLPGDPNNSRFPWDHPHLEPVEGEDYSLPEGCVQYFIAGHLPQKQSDYRKRYRTLASTYVTFSPTGQELLVNLGGEQIYLFDINSQRSSAALRYLPPTSQAATSHAKAACAQTNGYNVHRNGTTTNGITNGISRHSVFPPSSSTASSSSSDGGTGDGTAVQSIQPRERKRLRGEGSQMSLFVDRLKKLANDCFEREQYSQAIYLYNQALSLSLNMPILLANRAAAYMKRKWDGDMYAALRDCYEAMQLEPNHMKAHFRMARCLYELGWIQEAYDCLQVFKAKFPDYGNSQACSALDRDIKAAMFSRYDGDEDSRVEDTAGQRRRAAASEQEKKWQSEANDYVQRFCGHCNTTTDIKEANFFGSNGQYIVAGSDDGSFFIWEKKTTNIVQVLKGDDSIVNCLQPHPTSCLLATSGIDPVVRLWSPRPEDGSKNDREVMNSDDAASANQKRMNADPLEVMLLNMGYRITGFLDVDEDENSNENPTCRTT
ncbi:WD and tetratricopeptide repeats protein 1-like [Littorina saxatilis]|uniref:WD and tetratricopeptide repeats protein 1 n=1 Tax=Littorina saxatilis TaxID=31220 RepID=A0AAN9BNJ9_9CAEN